MMSNCGDPKRKGPLRNTGKRRSGLVLRGVVKRNEPSAGNVAQYQGRTRKACVVIEALVGMEAGSSGVLNAASWRNGEGSSVLYASILSLLLMGCATSRWSWLNIDIAGLCLRCGSLNWFSG